MRPIIKPVVHKGTPMRVYSIGWLCLFCGITSRSYRNYREQGFPPPIVKIDKTHKYFTAAELVAYRKIFTDAKLELGGKAYAKRAIAEARSWHRQFVAKFKALTEAQMKALADKPNILRLENDEILLHKMKEAKLRETEQKLINMVQQ